MIYGDNILTTAIADWEVVGGSVSTTTLSLDAGGIATQRIDPSKIGSIPEMLMVSLVASEYGDPYTSGALIIIEVITAEDRYTYNLPIIDTGNGVCVIEFPTTAVDYTSLSFTIKTPHSLIIADWGLFGPKSSEVDLTEVLDQLPRLLSDYNTLPLTNSMREDTVAMIASYVTETTELTGHFTMGYHATQPSMVVVRIKDNGITELMTPMIFQVAAGRGTITIPNAYLHKLKGYHTFTATVQVLEGELYVDTRNVSFVIDGGRIAYNVMDIGSQAYDITIRQLSTEREPSYIYAICIDGGICIIKQAQYAETPGAAWIAEATIGPAIDAAIEFDGAWDFSGSPYMFYTETTPWYAWVDPDGILRANKLGSELVPIQLATDVDKVAMVKGWNNQLVIGSDHGLIVGYIKNGSVYYRSRATQLDESIIWENERHISAFTGIAIDLQIFRTNDYRTGFAILDNNNTTHVYLSDRNWAGLGVELHTIRARAEALIDFLPITYYGAYEYERITVKADASADLLFARQDNSITLLENVPITRINEDEVEYQDWGFAVRVRFNYEVIGTPEITLTDPATPTTFSVLRIEEIEPGYEYLVLVDDDIHEFGFNTAGADLNVVVTNFTNEAGYNYDTIITSFTPINLVPPMIPLPEVEAIWNE